MRWFTKTYWGPFLTVVAAIAFAATAVLHVGFRDTRLVHTALNPRAGTEFQESFATPYPGLYMVSLEMDRTAASVLFPCTADFERLDEQCDGAPMPVRLAYSLTADGAMVDQGVFVPTGRGGSYTDKAFALSMFQTELAPGKRYVLSVENLSEGSSIAPAHPRIVVEADYTVGLVQMLMRLAISAGLLLVGVIWAGIVASLRWRLRRSAQAQAVLTTPS